MKNLSIIRQGDVLLIPRKEIPEGCVELKPEGGRIVLMHGEVTGHAHAIYDYAAPKAKKRESAAAITAQVIDMAQARAKARLLRAPDGIRYLEVSAPVNLKHEEHTPHEIPPGIYEIPVQVEHTTERVRRVAD